MVAACNVDRVLIALPTRSLPMAAGGCGVPASAPYGPSAPWQFGRHHNLRRGAPQRWVSMAARDGTSSPPPPCPGGRGRPQGALTRGRHVWVAWAPRLSACRLRQETLGTSLEQVLCTLAAVAAGS